MSDGESRHGDLSERFAAHAERVRRVSLEVLGELVTFTRRDGYVQIMCSCEQSSCEHRQAALQFFADGAGSASVSAREVKRSSLRPPPAPHVDATALAEALDELCLATARAGASMQESPSIRAALEQVTAAARQPLSLSLARFIGRFNAALAIGEVGKLARLLAGAETFVADVRRQDHSREARARARVWLGTADGDAPAALTDVTLVEIGREWLAGLTRSAIERRYLVDVSNGELYSEERRRGEQDISVGPCPRAVHIAFAELETATAPARARLLQYTVTPDPDTTHWDRLVDLAEARLPALAQRYANATRRCPGLAEPVVLFAPSELTAGPLGALRDAAGARLELRDDSDGMLVDAVRALVGGGQVVWVLGRLKGLARGLSLRPISLLVREKAGLSLRRVT